MTSMERQLCNRRVAKEFTDLANNPIPNVKVKMDPTDNLNWYCLIHDLGDEEYKNGEYILLIKLSPRYPFEAPDFFLLTPNGRFEIRRKLCFSNSSYHQETWSPIWTMRTIIMGFLSFFLEKSSRGVGHIDAPAEAKQELAQGSRVYNAAKHGSIMSLFVD